MMKLMMHNFLSSSFLKNVNKGYPLKLIATEIKIREQEFNPEFIVRMLSKLDYDVLREAARSIGYGEDLPETSPKIIIPGGGEGDSASAMSVSSGDETITNLIQQYDETFLKAVHRNLFEIEIIQGSLECPESGRKFPIKNGIPNMLANEDEVK